MTIRQVITKGLRRVFFYARHYWLLYAIRDPQTVWVRKWHRDQGDKALRYSYPLASSSLVVDLGGYLGDWAAEIHRLYRCRILIFEPVQQFFEKIVSRFHGIADIHCFNFGLASASRTECLSVHGESSSLFGTQGPRAYVKLVDIKQFVSEKAIENVDLMKINIEGGEYDLLEYMIAEKITDRCADIQIQFHRFVPGAEARRNAIRNALAQTHRLTYDYPFVWENWRRRV